MMSDSETYKKMLAHLAALKGIELEYLDNWGNSHPVPLETIRDLLAVQGYRLDSLEDLEVNIQTLEQGNWGPITRSVIVVTFNKLPTELLFRLPAAQEQMPNEWPEDLQIRLSLWEESGRNIIKEYNSILVNKKGPVTFGGNPYLLGGIPFPRELPLGRHLLILALSHDGIYIEQKIQVLVCPARSYIPPVLTGGGKKAGIIISLAGLRSAKNWGIGDFRDLKGLVRWAIEVLQVDLIGLLPLHALANREPYNISPYYPSSRLYRNPIYLSLPDLEDFSLDPKVSENLDNPETQMVLVKLRASEKVQFEKVDRLKKQELKKIFQAFLTHHWKPSGQGSPRQAEFRAYLKKEGDYLEKFAVFCALTEFFETQHPEWSTWGQWPVPYQDPLSEVVGNFRKEYWQEVLFHQYLQWQIEVQLSQVQELALKCGSEIGLYHDLALGVDPWGADAWAWRECTVPGVKVGAPPDDFSPQGQEWGFFPPCEEQLQKEGYRQFSLEICKNSLPGGALRIDHILRFSRLFWIIDGRTPKEGAYVKNPLEDYLKVLSLESLRNRILIIGEDLGTLPSGLHEVLQQYGIFSYRLFYFEKDSDGNLKSPGDYPEFALASISTHDLPPLAGFWGMKDLVLRHELGLFQGEESFHRAVAERVQEKRRMIDRLYQLGFLSSEEKFILQAQEEPVLTGPLHRAVLSFILNSRAKLAVISQEDLFGEMNQLNLPGTVTAYPNWARKMRYSLEELWIEAEVQEKAGFFRNLVEWSGRGVRKVRKPE